MPGGCVDRAVGHDPLAPWDMITNAPQFFCMCTDILSRYTQKVRLMLVVSSQCAKHKSYSSGKSEVSLDRYSLRIVPLVSSPLSGAFCT